MNDAAIPADLRTETASAWRRYLDGLTPFRPALHRYCRRLTGDIWDAEDLVQETLLKGFARLGSEAGDIANPQGYLTRIATRLWVDARRRDQLEARHLAAEAAATTGAAEPPLDLRELRAASAALFERLAPQERAAIVLREVFDMSLVEIAEALTTSVGAVKAALHRGRERVKDETRARPGAASAALVDRFVQRLDAADLEGLLALMLDTATIEMPGALVETGRAAFSRRGSWLWQAVNVHPELPPQMRPPKWRNERVEFRGEPIVLGFAPTPDGPRLQGITRFEEAEGKIARIRSYCFSPETAAEVADELGLTVGWIPYRFATLPPAAT